MSFSLPSNAGDLVTGPIAGARQTVLDFFGPSCEPCAKKVPVLVGRRSDIEKRGGRLVLVGVLADGESTSDAERALAKWGVRASFLVDRAGVALREAGVKDLPSTIILDASGATRWRAPIRATAEDDLGRACLHPEVAHDREVILVEGALAAALADGAFAVGIRCVAAVELSV